MKVRQPRNFSFIFGNLARDIFEYFRSYESVLGYFLESMTGLCF